MGINRETAEVLTKKLPTLFGWALGFNILQISDLSGHLT